MRHPRFLDIFVLHSHSFGLISDMVVSLYIRVSGS
jgi:hypothetical protein